MAQMVKAITAVSSDSLGLQNEQSKHIPYFGKFNPRVKHDK